MARSMSVRKGRTTYYRRQTGPGQTRPVGRQGAGKPGRRVILERYGPLTGLGMTEDACSASLLVEALLVEIPPLGFSAYWETADHVNYLHPQY